MKSLSQMDMILITTVVNDLIVKNSDFWRNEDIPDCPLSSKNDDLGPNPPTGNDWWPGDVYPYNEDYPDFYLKTAAGATYFKIGANTKFTKGKCHTDGRRL